MKRMTSHAMKSGAVDPRLSGLVDRIDLQSAVDQLPDGYRQIFILHDVLGFDSHGNCRDSWMLDRELEVSIAQGSQAIARTASESKEIRTGGESRSRQPLSGARRELLALGAIYLK